MNVFEAFGFGDVVQVLPPALVSVFEAFGFTDDPRVVPPALVQVSEGFGFGDATQILVPESVVVVALKNIGPEDIRLISMAPHFLICPDWGSRRAPGSLQYPPRQR